MGEKYTPAKGDRVRVTFEDTVVSVHGDEITLENPPWPKHWVFSEDEPTFVSIEKLEPPVVKFKPGDTVRNKSVPRWVYTVGKNGYYDHEAKRVFVGMMSAFSSRDYELVEQPS